MGFLTHGEPVRVDLGEGFWADVRSGLSFGDMADAQKKLSAYRVADNDVVSEPDIAGYQIEMVKRALLSWNLTDENDGLLPTSPPDKLVASLKRLPQWAFNTIYSKVADLNNERSPLEEHNFPKGPAVGDSGSDTETALSTS